MIAKKRALLLLTFILSIALTLIAVVLVVKTAGVQRTASASTAVRAVTMVLCFFSYLWLRRKFGEGTLQPFWPRYGWAIAGWTVIALMLSMIPNLATVGWQQIHWENLRIELVFSAATLAISAAFVEEVLCRDMLFRWMLGRYSVTTSLLAQIIIFSAVHFISQRFSWNAVITYSIGAILYSLLWLLTEDFVAPMAAHFVWDFTILIFDGINMADIVRAGLLYGDTQPGQIYGHLALKVLAILAVWWAWRRKCKRQR